MSARLKQFPEGKSGWNLDVCTSRQYQKGKIQDGLDDPSDAGLC